MVKVIDNILKSQSDERIYRGIELENGMKVLLVSDPTTDKSAAAVDVNAGFLMESIHGLAHFCEHMLFQGSKKYPSDNTFRKFIQDHGGLSNAFTKNENTVYFFDIANNYLEEALDIFSQFFIAPIFAPDSTDREINAVNSENNKNLRTDAWRIGQFKRSLCKETHPYTSFGTGSTATLKTEPEKKGISIRDELLKFHTKYYSSNIMTGCILGAESLEKLQKYAVNMFSVIPNKNAPRITFDSNPFKKEALKCIHYVIPVEIQNHLHLSFQLPSYRKHYNSSPTYYIIYLLMNEGPGSLISHLKKNGWCNALSPMYKDEALGVQFFEILFDFTEEGINHVLEVIQLFFQYMNLLRNTSVQKWIHDEIIDLGKITFRFKNKVAPRSYVEQLSGALQKYQFDEVLYAGYYATKFEPRLMEEIMNLIRPELMVPIIVSKKFDGTTNKVEKWYGTQYRSDPIPAELLNKWQNCGLNDAFKLPEPNNLIPKDISFIEYPHGNTDFPVIIKKTPLTRIWYKTDDKFLLPKAYFSIALRNPLSQSSPKNSNMTELFLSLVNDSLQEFTYQIKMAGFKYSLNSQFYGIKFIFGGFNTKLDYLLKIVMKRISSFTIDENRFKILLERYKRNLVNYQSSIPVQHAVQNMNLILNDNFWSKEELLEAVDTFSIKDLQKFIPNLLKNGVFVESFMYGNISKESTLQMAETFERYLHSASTSMLVPLPMSQHNNIRYFQLPSPCDLVYVYNNKIHQTVGIEAFYQCEEDNMENRVLLDLYCQIVKESAFNILRTQEQLGYIVMCTVRKEMVVPGIRFNIQSDKLPTFLDQRIENFLNRTGETLNNMTDNDFKTSVDALKVNKLEKPKSMEEQFERYWSEIVEQKYMFDRANIEVKYLETIKKTDIIDLHKRLLCSTSSNRKKLAVYVTPVSMNTQFNETIKAKNIQNIKTFKAGLQVSPLKNPHIEL